MIKISAIIIAKNEEAMIRDCLRSVSFCDEVIVVDAGSTDNTARISRKEGAIIVMSHTSDFSEARNRGKAKARGEWLLYVDADERVSKSLARNIIEEIYKKNQQLVAFRLLRKNYYYGQYEWPYVEKLERLFKKASLVEWYGELHESPKIIGEVGDLEGNLLHFTHRDLSKMVDKTILWSSVEAKLRFDTHHPKITWWRFPRVMFSAFFTSFITQRGLRAGTVGIIESIYQAYSMFFTYVKLWEMQNKEVQTRLKTK
jgi:glycosyltransferase involved in cell wall biosynthesis